jgi:hypothetical protein
VSVGPVYRVGGDEPWGLNARRVALLARFGGLHRAGCFAIFSGLTGEVSASALLNSTRAVAHASALCFVAEVAGPLWDVRQLRSMGSRASGENGL